MEKITFFVICVLAAFEGYVADSQPNVGNLGPSIPPPMPSMPKPPMPRPSVPETESDGLSVADRAELQIINLCTEVPTFYDELISSYTSEQFGSTEGLQKIREIEEKLKSLTDELKTHVTEYDESNEATDPDAKTIQNLMSSAVDELMQSVNEINGELNSEISQTAESAAEIGGDRAKILQQRVRPAMVKFEESCLLQTKDILKNVLQDYEASLLS